MVLCELTRHFHPVLSPSWVAEGSRSGDRFQDGLDRGCPCLQLASSSSAPRASQCGKEKVIDQLTFGRPCSMTKPAEPSLHEQCRYTCKAEAATQFHGWHTISTPYACGWSMDRGLSPSPRITSFRAEHRRSQFSTPSHPPSFHHLTFTIFSYCPSPCCVYMVSSGPLWPTVYHSKS